MKVLLADDSGEVRSALRLVLEHQPGSVRAAGPVEAEEAGDAVHLLALCARCCPDAVILDTELPGLTHLRGAESLVELLQTLRSLCPRARLIALSSYQVTGKEPWAGLVCASFCKTDPPDALLRALS